MSPALRAAGLAAAAALLYAPALAVVPFGDDRCHVAWARHYGFDLLFEVPILRLFERLANALNYALLEQFGTVTIALNLVVLLGCALLVARVTRRLAPVGPAPVVAAALFLAHPANASAVIQVGTASTGAATLFSLALVEAAALRAQPAGPRAMALAALLALGALLAKESTLGVVAWLPAAVGLGGLLAGRGARASLRDGFATAVAVVAAVAAWAALRIAAGATFGGDAGEGRYSFSLEPARLALNGAQLVAAAAFFGDSARVIVHGWSAAQVAIAVASAAALVLALTALVRTARGGALTCRPSVGTTLLLASFVPASLFPVVMLGHVSELYAMALAPFVAILLGWGLAPPAAVAPRAALTLAGLLAVAGATAIVGKQLAFRQVSQVATRFTDEFESARAALPGGELGSLCITGDRAQTTSGGRPYSVYSASAIQVARWTLGTVYRPLCGARRITADDTAPPHYTLALGRLDRREEPRLAFELRPRAATDGACAPERLRSTR